MSKMPEMTDEIRERLKQYHGGDPVACGCGGKPIVFQTNAMEHWFVQCSHCYIATRGVATRAGAVLVWNEAMGVK